MSIQDLSFDSYVSNNKNNFCELIDNDNYLENLDFDFSFIENKLIKNYLKKKLPIIYIIMMIHIQQIIFFIIIITKNLKRLIIKRLKSNLYLKKKF